MRGFVLVLFYALLLDYSEGEKCVCTSFWECSTTGGSPIAFCGQDTNEVCCVHEELSQGNALNGEGIGLVIREKSKKALDGEGPGKPPPPVRLFGDRKTKPIVNTALRNAIPVRLIKVKSAKASETTEDRSLLDAFPRNLVSTPDIIDPLRRQKQQSSTKTDVVPSSSPVKITGKSLTFRAGGDSRPVTDEQSQVVRIPVGLPPLTDARLRGSIDVPLPQQPPQIGGPLPSLAVVRLPLAALENGQNAFTFADSSSSNRGAANLQPNTPRTSQFSFRDTRP